MCDFGSLERVAKNIRVSIDLPEEMLAELKVVASRRRLALDQLFLEAIDRYLIGQRAEEPAWMKSFGAFKNESNEVERIQAVIDEEFSKIDSGDW